MRGRTVRTNRARREFLEHLAASGNVTESAKIAGIGRRTVYEWREDTSDFAKDWDEAEEIAVDALRAEARRRALEGNEQPVFHNGVVCGHIRKYSDRMLELLLKRHDPEFRDTTTVGGTIKHKHEVRIVAVSESVELARSHGIEPTGRARQELELCQLDAVDKRDGN